MIDEIQQVLEAQAGAEADVESARERNAAALAAAGAQARAIREHNARRALRAIRRYEGACAGEVARASEGLQAQAERGEQAFRNAVRQRMDDLVKRTLARLWPD